MDVVINCTDRNKQRQKQLAYLRFVLCAVLLFVIFSTNPVFAGDGFKRGNLTDLFSTDAFTGNWEVFTKMNFIGRIMSWVISAFSLIGLFTVGMRLMLDLLYLSGKNFWDNVEEIKSSGRNQKMLGLGASFQDLWNAKYGTGLDAVVSFLFSLFPSIKAYSSYASDAKHTNNYAETDTVTSYLLKSAIPNIMIIFAFTMGFNGTLFQAYGVTVEALGTVTQSFVDTNLSSLVDRALNTGSSYKFAHNADGSKYGDFKQTVVKKVYSSLLKNTTDLTSSTKISLGKAIDDALSTPIDCMSVIAALQEPNKDQKRMLRLKPANGGEKDYDVTNVYYSWGKGTFTVQLSKGGNSGLSITSLTARVGDITDAKANNLSYSVVVNNTKSYDGALSVPASQFGFEDKDYYVHIFITKKAGSDEHHYFTINKNDK